jgi:superfamily II DNA or RNA helicase
MRVNVRDDYESFLASKLAPGVRYDGDYAVMPDRAPVDGAVADVIAATAPHLHEYQRFAAAFAAARRRAALFLECGLGKTSIALAWIRAVAGAKPSMISAPLAACHEFLNERDKFFSGMDVRIVATADVDAWLKSPQGVALVTHHAFVRRRNLAGLQCFVLDESSILKSGDGAIASNLKASAAAMPNRLALSATPAPNDPTEYAAHTTFLGYMRTDAEFNARFFVRDGKFWRLKAHAADDIIDYLSSFALWMRTPESYGMPCSALPADDYSLEMVDIGGSEVDVPRDLFGVPLAGATMSKRAELRRALYSDDDRMDAVIELARRGPSIVWATLNKHADALEKAIEASGVRVAQIAGKTSEDERVRIVRAFQAGDLDCIVSKPKVIGHGVNMQRASVMVFAAYDESYEAHHQAIRRAHRQGREGRLAVFMVRSTDERRVVASLRAKREEWASMADMMESKFSAAVADDVEAFRNNRAMRVVESGRERMHAEQSDWYTLANDDCIAHMRDEMKPESMDLAVFSPPFSSLFTYSSEREDMGNCSEQGDAEFSIHFAHFADQLLRVMRPGRVVCLHLAQIIAVRNRHGRKGIRDFRGMVIDRMEASGFHFYGEFVIPKNPQAVAIRTKSERLQFSQFKRDSLESSPALNDYVLEFRRPGKQAVQVKNDVSNEEWISWASGVWSDIRETDVIHGWQAGRTEEDEKHICPLQLEVIRRCVRLWSNPGEVVFTPFLGIGSEVYVAIEQGRKGYGVELKPEYFRQAVRNAEMSITRTHRQQGLGI